MEGVPEDHLVAEVLDLVGLERADGRVRGERHERRRLDGTVWQMKNARAG
jgi:hypothetical protein